MIVLVPGMPAMPGLHRDISLWIDTLIRELRIMCHTDSC